MLKIMFRTAWRSAIRHRQFTLLNILGLSIGITTCLLISLYVQDELSSDNFHQNKSRLFRVNQSFIWGDWNDQMSTTGPNTALALRADIPEFEHVTRVLPTGPFGVSYQHQSRGITSFLEERHLIVEEDFLDIFSFEVVEGPSSGVLDEPFQIVITEATARKYFGEESALGKTLHMKGTVLEGNAEKEETWRPFTVTAVLRSPPENSHIQFDMLTSMSSYPVIKSNESTWVWTAFVNYALVKEGTDLAVLNDKMQSIPPKWAESTLQRVFNQTFEELEKSGKAWQLHLQPIEDIYLDAQLNNSLGSTGSKKYIKIFSAVGFIILALSCFNFMNLSTARSANRAKEVGVRKVLGSHTKWLVRQFIFESVLYALISTVFAIVAAEMALPFFNDFAQKELSLYAQLSNPLIIALLVGFVVVLGYVAGIYPAHYLSSFKPVEVLKGQLSSGKKGRTIRNALVVFQFSASLALIVSTFFVHKQLWFTAGFDVGYDKEHVLQLHNIEHLESQADVLKNLLAENANVKIIGQSHEVPPNVNRGDIVRADQSTDDTFMARMKTDQAYLELLSPNWLAGRNFDPSRATDKISSVVLNAAAVRALGYGLPSGYGNDSPIGKFIFRGDRKFEIIGVMDDFNFNSLKKEVLPLIVYHIENPFLPDSGTSPSFFSLRLDPQMLSSGKSVQSFISEVESSIRNLDSAFPFEYSFMDQSFESSFRSEQRMGNILNVFTTMALIIACLGLFGLAAFSAEQRTREFGIRKVLGAKVTDLVVLISSEFTRLILVSVLIASPVAYYFVKSWLSGFAYQTPISAWVFVLAGVAALVVAWSTIGLQFVKTARLNPIDAIKDE